MEHLYSSVKEKLKRSQAVKPGVGDKKACVALLIRKNTLKADNRTNEQKIGPVDLKGPFQQLDDFQTFFILRAENEKDRWGGHVGFPGGRQEVGETDLETCKREVLEEVGMTLDGTFQLLGALNDRVVLHRTHRLIIRCFVFGEDPGTTIADREAYEQAMVIDEEEVQACGWSKINAIADEANMILIEHDLKSWLPEDTSSHLSGMIAAMSRLRSVLGINKVCFTGIRMPVSPLYYPAGAEQAMLADKAVQAGAKGSVFTLWGLTLGLMNDFLYTQLRYVHEQLYAKDKFVFDTLSVEKHFKDTRIHNLLIHLFRKSATLLLGRNVSWGEMMFLYPGFYTAFATGSAVATFPVAKNLGKKLLSKF